MKPLRTKPEIDSKREGSSATYPLIAAMVIFAAALAGLVSACTPGFKSRGSIAIDGAKARLLQEKNIWRFDLEETNTVALTFDDGPTAETTATVLDILKSEGVHASFFLVGKHIKGNEAQLARMRDEGHVMGNHSYTHMDFTGAEAKAMGPMGPINEVLRTHYLMKPYLRPHGRLYFRAPFGDWNAELATAMNSFKTLKPYVGPIYWNEGGELKADPESPGDYTEAADWACWDPKNNVSVPVCANAYFREIERHRGGVVLMHDHDPRTAELVKLLIPWLKDAGYTFVTLDDLSVFGPPVPAMPVAPTPAPTPEPTPILVEKPTAPTSEPPLLIDTMSFDELDAPAPAPATAQPTSDLWTADEP